MHEVLGALEDPELRMDQRVVLAWLHAKAEVENGYYPRLEEEIAILVGMSPASVRQAIIGLRERGLVRREYLSLNGMRPLAFFGVNRPWAE